MKSKRQLQVAEQIKRNFGIILQQEGSYIYGVETLVTVTSVKMSPDFGIAKIYLSVYNTEDKQSVILLMEEQYPRL
ncbi:MAG: ribosome-binding factor A, partial [Bacteroidota bacterium]